MKYYIIILLASIMMLGCEHKHPDGSYDSQRNIDISTVAIDSCEYINGFYKLAHKGNCKYCAKRRKAELEKLIKAIKEAEK